MYGFGDDEKPAHDSLEAAKLTSPTPKRLRVEDIKRVYRHDKKKLDRIEELLWMRKEIERARRVDDFKEFVEEEKEKEREQRRRA
ncbi:hypothetical protein BT69DRAFT_1287694 [Atractiella rhizophila]|nr:hypothetical protein BT69DRAFT_1287694 [Atractiella rhizophila]